MHDDLDDLDDDDGSSIPERSVVGAGMRCTVERRQVENLEKSK